MIQEQDAIYPAQTLVSVAGHIADTVAGKDQKVTIQEALDSAYRWGFNRAQAGCSN